MNKKKHISNDNNKNYPSYYLVPSLTTKSSQLFENVNEKGPN